MNEKTYRDLLPVIVNRVGAVLPPGFNAWGLKSVYSDLTTSYRFKWAMPGGRSRSDHAVVAGNTKACPAQPGDGLCVATNWRGMASGGISASTLLLVAYRSDAVLGADLYANKLRVAGEVAVVAIVDGWRLLSEVGAGADLSGADLVGADLTDADLSGADLSYTDLTRTDLSDAILTDADMTGASLCRADLPGADLTRTDLSRARMRSAGLADANLTGADLTGADMTGADLTGADMTGADLTGANLRRAVNVHLPPGWELNQNGLAFYSRKLGGWSKDE